MTFDEVLTRLAAHSPEEPRQVGDNWVLCCPAHDDHSPSLSVAEGADRKTLIICYAGCATEEVVAAVGLTMADLIGERPARSADFLSRPRIVGQYTYTDESGQALFAVRRYEPKAFRQFSPDGSGGWSPGLNGVRQVPYRLPKVIEAVRHRLTIFVVEGEKDVHSVEGVANWTATCNPGGAGNWRGEYNQYFRGAKRVVVIADNDRPGIRHARAVAANLSKVVETVELRRPAGGCKDFSDHRTAGHGFGELVALGDSEGFADDVAAREAPRPARRLSFTQASRVVPERVSWIWEARIPVGKIICVDGHPGVGKSTATLDFAASVATGRDMPDGTPCGRTGDVLVLCAEDDAADTIVPRLIAAGADLARVHVGPVIIGPNDEGIDDVSLPVDVGLLDEEIASYHAAMVVIDPFAAYVGRQVDLHRDQDSRGVMRQLKSVAAKRSCSIVLVRHLTKAGGTNAVLRGQGSIGLVGGARGNLIVARDPGDETRSIIAPGKANLAPGGSPALAFRLETVEELGCARVSWEGPAKLPGRRPALRAKPRGAVRAHRGP